MQAIDYAVKITGSRLHRTVSCICNHFQRDDTAEILKILPRFA